MSGAAQVIRSITGRRGVRPCRVRPWRDLERTLTDDPERLRRLLACPAHELAAAVSSEPAAPVFWDVIERILRRRGRTLRSLA